MTAATSQHLSPDVQGVLQRSAVNGNRLVLPEQLDRRLYVQVDKCLKLMGGKWNRSARAHVFEDYAEDVVADAVATGAVADLRKLFQFFESPPAVVRQLVELAQLEPHHAVLEPSAGRGAIIEAIRAVGIEPVACELWDKNRVHLKSRGVTLVDQPDFLKFYAQRAPARFDRIVANPPFTRGQDIAHVTHMLELLAHGGRVVSVMSPAWKFHESKRAQAFRELAEKHDAVWHWLPEGAFASSGTNVRAGIIVMERA